MDPTAYLLVLLGALSICGLGAMVAPRAERPCPRCDVLIAVAARRCRSCGYVMP